jgi:heat shock protein HtpX
LFLSNALRKLDAKSKLIPMEVTPATAHLFIISPFAGLGGITKLFSTHPPVEERIALLEEMRLS